MKKFEAQLLKDRKVIPKRNQPKQYDKHFVSHRVTIPIGLNDKLMEAISLHDTNISRAFAIAIDNELSCEQPFDLDTDVPTEYVKYKYASEANDILDFLRQFQKGLSIHMLMLCRYDIGIPDRETFMYAFQELAKTNNIEAFEHKSAFAKTTEIRWRAKELVEKKRRVGRRVPPPKEPGT